MNKIKGIMCEAPCIHNTAGQCTQTDIIINYDPHRNEATCRDCVLKENEEDQRQKDDRILCSYMDELITLEECKKVRLAVPRICERCTYFTVGEEQEEVPVCRGNRQLVDG